MTGIIDADIHPWFGKLDVIFPYLPSTWRRRLQTQGDTEFLSKGPGRAPDFGADGESINLKPDAIPPDGGLPGSDPVFLCEHHLDPHGIEAGLLLMIEGGRLEVWTDPDEAAAIARGLNEFAADQWLAVDERYHLAMAVSPHDPARAAEEIRRFGPTERVAGIWFPVINKPMGDRAFYPIYEAAEELGLALIVHPTGSEGDYITSPGYAGGVPPLEVERMTLLGEIAMTNVVSLIFQGVFERFPKLRVVFVEYGFSWMPSLLWRMESMWRAARTSTPWVVKSPTEYLVEHIRFTSEPVLEIPNERLLRQVLDQMHASRTLLYSSDYPHWDGEEDPHGVFKTVPNDMRNRIFRENAIETFGDHLVLAGARV